MSDGQSEASEQIMTTPTTRTEPKFKHDQEVLDHGACHGDVPPKVRIDAMSWCDDEGVWKYRVVHGPINQCWWAPEKRLELSTPTTRTLDHCELMERVCTNCGRSFAQHFGIFCKSEDYVKQKEPFPPHLVFQAERLLTASEWEDKMKGIATTTTLECDKTYLCGAGLVATIRPDELKRLREVEKVAVSLIESWKRCGIKYGDGLDAADALWRLVDPAPAFTPPPKPELRLWDPKGKSQPFWGYVEGHEVCGTGLAEGLWARDGLHELDPVSGKPLEKQA